VDHSTLATATVAILAPYVKKASKAWLENPGKFALAKSGSCGRISAKFSGDGPAELALANFEQAPRSLRSSSLATTLAPTEKRHCICHGVRYLVTGFSRMRHLSQ